MRRLPTRSLAGLAALLLAAGCGPPPENGSDAPPAGPEAAVPAALPAPDALPGAPVVLISIDTLRSDRLPAYGYDGVSTPAIDAFAASAVLFERAYSHYPLTLPSHVSLLSGQLPPENGVRDNAGYRLPEGHAPFLPSILRAAGYRTGAAVSSYAIRSTTGIAQGFDVYDDKVEEDAAAGAWGPERFGPDTLAVARRLIDGWLNDGDEPFFLFFHIYEPHQPYTPPEPFRERYGETYEAEIAAADAVVGELLDELKRRGVYDDALVVLLSDHGEGLEDHGEDGHGLLLYRESVQVPLMVKPPGRQEGRSVSTPVQLVDVVPTVLDLVGLPRPDGLAGTSLFDNAERRIYTETWYPRRHFGWSELASLVRGRFHYIEGPDPELYDLAADPAETTNVLRENRRVYTELRDHLATLHTPLDAPAVDEDPETLAKLAALGYLGGSVEVDPADGPLPDPKDRVRDTMHLIETFDAAIGARRWDEAVALGRQLTAENSRMTNVWRMMGKAYKQTGRLEESLDAYRKAFELSQASPQILVQVGQVLAALGRLDEAARHADLAADREPLLAAELRIEVALARGDVDTARSLLGVRFGSDRISDASHQDVALALVARGRFDDAIAILEPLAAAEPTPPTLNALAFAHLEAGRPRIAGPLLLKVLEQHPENALAHERLALLALQSGNLPAARGHLERSLASEPASANAWNLLGVARFQGGDRPGALDAWQRSVELDPRQWDSLYNLAFTAANLGRRDLAVPALRQYVDTAPPNVFGREIADARRLLARLGG